MARMGVDPCRGSHKDDDLNEGSGVKYKNWGLGGGVKERSVCLLERC